MRRSRLRWIAVMTALMLVVGACGSDGESSDTTAAAGDPVSETTAAGEGRPFEGVELTLLIHPTLYGATGDDEGLVPEFEEMTGARVEVVTAPIGEHLERAMAEFAAGSGRLDVMNMQGQDLHSEVTPFLLDVSSYVDAAGDWNYDDFPASLREPATSPEGGISAIPFRIGVTMMYYRGDLLEEIGMDAPTTLDELRDFAAAISENYPEVTPVTQRGKAEEIVHDWLAFLHAAGGDLLSDDLGVCTANSAAGVEAADMWAEFYADGYLPDDLFAVGRDEYIEAMRQGRAAMGFYFSPYWGTITAEGPDFADDMAWGVMPTDPSVESGRAWYQAWYLTVNKDSANPDAAWALVEWITNEENSLRSALDWANGPVRASTYNDPTYQEAFPLAGEWLTAVAASTPLPAVAQNSQIVDILSEELTRIISGDKDSQQGLDDACQRIDDLL